MADTDIVYFCGYKPEHFTGKGGTGSPSYTSVSASSTTAHEPNGLGSILLSDTAGTAYPNNAACLWGTFSNSDGTQANLSEFWVTAEMISGVITAALGGLSFASPTGAIALHAASDYAILVSLAGGGHAPSSEIYLYDGSTSTATALGAIPTIATITSGGSGDGSVLFYIKISGAGTANGLISFYTSTGTLIISFTADLTKYTGFYAISFAGGALKSSTGISSTYLYYCYVTNYDPRQSYLIYTAGTAAATKDDWQGNNSTFNTYPIDYLATSSGYYTTSVGDEITFGGTNTSVTVPTGYEVRTVFTSDAMVCGTSDTGVTVEGLIYDDTTSTDLTTGTSFTLSPTGSNFFQTLYTDPVTGKPWTASAFNSYEFGVKRTG